jgi:hypothetical protein
MFEREEGESQQFLSPDFLLNPQVANDWDAIRQAITPAYGAIAGYAPRFTVSFVNQRRLEETHGLVGVLGEALRQGTARVAGLRGKSETTYARFYFSLFHELGHLDKDQEGQEGSFVDFLQGQGLWLKPGKENLDVIYGSLQGRFPKEVKRVDNLLFGERIVSESRAQIFAQRLGDKVFADHHFGRVLAHIFRSELFSSAELYSGTLDGGYDILLADNLLALLALKREKSVVRALESLKQPMTILASLAVPELKAVRRTGFVKTIMEPVDEVLRKEYGLRRYRVNFLWSGNSDELDGIGDPSHPLFQLVSFCAREDAVAASKAAAKVLTAAIKDKS